MLYFGESADPQFAFDNGLFCGFRVIVHRKQLTALHEKFDEAAIGVIEFDTPHFSETNLPRKRRSALGATQRIDAGYRRLKVTSESANIKKNDENSKPDYTVSSVLTMTFSLDRSLSWQLLLKDVLLEGHRDASQCVLLQLPNNISIKLSATSEMFIQMQTTGDANYVTVTTEWPSGESQLQITVTSTPFYPVSDTVVICRSNQIREAAIVLSCLRADKYSPLIVVDKPPITKEEYSSIYTQFLEAHDESMSNIIGMGRLQTIQGDKGKVREAFKKMGEHWNFQDQLTPYRSWIKHNLQINQLLSGLGVERVVLLFGANHSDLLIYPPDELKRVVGDNASVSNTFIPVNSEIICFLEGTMPNPELLSSTVSIHRFPSLEELPDIAWQVLRGESAPSCHIQVAENDNSSCLLGLYDSLDQQIPLRFGSPTQSAASPVRPLKRVAERDDEVILVESSGNASDLVGVLYASFRGAKLVVSAEPDLGTVNQSLVDFNEAQLSAVECYRYVAAHFPQLENLDELTESEKQQVKNIVRHTRMSGDDKHGNVPHYRRNRFIDLIRRFILGDWETRAIERIESTVSSQIPDYVVDEVGTKALTAFTKGLPYSFFKRDSLSWSEKPIGHIVNDPGLMVLREIYLKGCLRYRLGLGVIFDPGYFQTSETEDVLQALEATFKHAVVLDQKTASLKALIHFSRLRNLDLLFFNTHGSDNSIMLNIPVENTVLVQWVSFSASPIVFNNSCLSWTGVGREFIRNGARGYIGTLWSVDSKHAAEIARIVMKRLTVNRSTVASSLCNMPVSELTKRSYVFIGTSDAILDEWPATVDECDLDYITCGALLFSELLLDTPMLNKREDLNLINLYHRHLVAFVERIEQYPASYTPQLFDIRYAELQVLAHESRVLNVSPEYGKKIVKLCREYLPNADYSDDKKKHFLVALTKIEAKLSQQQGNVLNAIELIENLAEGDAEEGGEHLSMFVQMLMQSGQIKKALEVGLKAEKYLEEKGDKSKLVTIVGNICQLYKRTGDLDKGLEFARRGFTLSAEIGEEIRQPTFKLDEAHLLQLKGLFDEAIETSKVAAQLFRSQHDEEGDLRCHGVIGQCYIHKRKLNRARKWLRDGYQQAKKISDKQEVANFSGDLGLVEALSNNYELSARYYLEALELFIELGEFGSIINAMSLMSQQCSEQKNYKLLGNMLCILLLILPKLHQIASSSILPIVVDAIKTACITGNAEDQQAVLAALGLAWQAGSSVISQSEDKLANYFTFMFDVVGLFIQWLSGNFDNALERARVLDIASDSVLRLEEWVNKNTI